MAFIKVSLKENKQSSNPTNHSKKLNNFKMKYARLHEIRVPPKRRRKSTFLITENISVIILTSVKLLSCFV